MESTQVESGREVCNGLLLKYLIAAGHTWLKNNMEHVNELNVFPVPDGDTGTNMHLTMRKAYEEVNKLDTDEPDVSTIAQAAAKGALMGARGNSGVILSQILAGFAEGLKDLQTFNAHQLADACKISIDYAYKAVVDPVEGTILTVSREAGEALIALVENNGDIPLRRVLERFVEAAEESLKRTPEKLKVLKEAGVVDSGGAGFLYIIQGMLRILEGKPVEQSHTGNEQATGETAWEDALEPEDEEGYGYDVQFLIHGDNLDVPQVRADIDAMGWSTLVVGDPQLVKVHVHVHNPATPLNYAIETLGAEIDDIVVENMQLQYRGYVEQRKARESGLVNEVEGTAVITVVAGDGLSKIYKNDFQVSYIIHGGQTMNPSTEDFVAAINAVPNKHIVLLPNNKNILMAANQAAKMTNIDKDVRVVPSRTVPQGIAAMVGYLNAGDAELDDLVEEMRNVMGEVTTIEITTATRDALIDEVNIGQGQFIALVDGKLADAGDDMQAVITASMRRAVRGDSELVTLYYGADETPESAAALCEALSDDFPELIFESIEGGQALYPYLISIE